jgi:Tol biopolymer transport system component
MRSFPLRPVLLALAVAGACNHDYPSPFGGQGRTMPPPSGAALLFTSAAWATQSGSGRELFAANADGSAVTRLTFCNDGAAACDTIEAAIASDRRRTEVRRVKATTQGTALVYIDLQQSADAEIIPASQQVSGVDWSSQGDVLVYSAFRAAGVDDLFRVDPNGQNAADLSCTTSSTAGTLGCDPTIRERRPRIDPTGNVAVYERIDARGRGQIYIFQNSANKIPVTTGGTPGAALPGTPYVVGSDADPAYSPDGGSIVFRRLTGLGNGGLGTWDLLTVHTDGTGLAVLVTGPLFRGAPDWGAAGIVFAETDGAAALTSLVVVKPDGSGRRVLLTQSASFHLGFPRWLPAAR